METDKAVRQLRRNIIAQSAFREARAGCEFLMTLSKEHDAYAVISTGIGVTYTRPFMSATGLGHLDPKRYGTFPGRPDLQHLHDDLLAGRNSIDAHYSPQEAARLLMDPAQKIEQQRLRMIREDGNWHVQPPLAVWDIDRLPAIVDLIDFQFYRLLEEGRKLLTALEQGKDWPDGLYHLGETFP